MRRALPPLRALLRAGGAGRPPWLPALRGLCGAPAAEGSGGGSQLNIPPSFGFLFDIDGVLVRGKTPIPAAKTAFQKLVNSQGQFLVPVVFVTNAGNCLRQEKADQLSHLLGVPISQDQVMMSHSPLRMFKRYHEKCVLVSGQGPLLDIARDLGFCQPVTIETLREKYPLLDVVDHDRRPNVLAIVAFLSKMRNELFRNNRSCSYSGQDGHCRVVVGEGSCFSIPYSRSSHLKYRNVETGLQDVKKSMSAVVLFGEPVRWETNLQLIIDVLLTSGYPGNPYHHGSYPHIPVLACNMDLMWVAEAQSPRFGHGTFMVCLENIYKKITGKDLKYEALMGKPSKLTYQYAEYLIRAQAAERRWKQPIQTLYAIGDNLMTDVYGANLYNRYLEENSRKGSKSRIQAKVAGGRGPATVSQDDEIDNSWENELASAAAARCRSVLVCTGVYNPHTEVPLDTRENITETVFHGHRDFRFDPGLVEPDHIVPDVDAAVDLVFQLENFSPN